MPAYVLVEVDGNPILVKTDVEELPELHVKYSYCHKRFTAETCVVVTSYSDEEFSERIPVGRFTVECDGKVVKDDLIELSSEDEVEKIKDEYEDEYEGCQVHASLLTMSRAELRLVMYFRIYKALDTDNALLRASMVIDRVVELDKH